MKRAWMRFWLSASVLVLATGPAVAPQGNSPPARRSSHRVNESKIAGLWPGRTSLTRAEALLGKASKKDPDSLSAAWHSCLGMELLVDFDGSGIVQMIRAARNPTEAARPACSEALPQVSRWATGKGLRLGDPTERVFGLYGVPDSRSPSTKDGQRLELLYYAFDWAGPDVPQVMEVLCTMQKDGRPGQVVEIMLAASSL